MSEINILVEKIQSYIQNHPETKGLSEKELLSIMVQNNTITTAELAEAQKTSAFTRATAISKTNMTGLEVERNTYFQPNTGYATSPETINLTREEAQAAVIDDLSTSLQAAIMIMLRQDNGTISKAYDSLKEYFDAELSEKNVGEAIDNQMKSIEYLQKAKENNLSKKEYYIENRERLKKMMIKRLYQKDEKSGLDFLDRMKGDLSKEDLGKFLEKYINDTIDKLSQLSTASNPDGAINAIKEMQHTLMSQDIEKQNEMLSKLLDGAKKAKSDEQNIEGQNQKIEIPSVPPSYNSDEKMSFEETFKLERGVEFSQELMSSYVQKKAEFNIANGAHNKYQQFTTEADNIIKNSDKQNSTELANSILKLFENYYANSPEEDAAKKHLEKLIKQANLPIEINKNLEGKYELDLRALQDESQRNKTLIQLLQLGKQEQKNILDQLLNGKDISYYADNYQQASEAALGNEDAEELASAMENDNMDFIQTYSTGTMLTGVGLSAVGKLLTFTPLSPVGITMFATGNVLMAGGMVAKNSLGFTEALTRNSVNNEELKGLSKGLLMDIGGLVIGYNAGKLGAQIKSSMLNSGSGAIKAIVAEKGTDFAFSLAGDLAMMGVLNTNDTAGSLTLGNMMGTAVSTILGLKAGKMSTPETKQTLEMLVKGGMDTIPTKVSDNVIQNSYIAKNITDNIELSDLDKKIIQTLQDGENHTIIDPNGNEITIIKNKDNFDIEVREANTPRTERTAKYGDYGYNPYEIRTGRMQPGAAYTLNLDKFPTIQLPGGQVIDFNTPEYNNILLNLQEGQYLTIGREGNIPINDPSGLVSRQHLIIFKENGQIKIKDISSNGTIVLSDANNIPTPKIAQGTMIKNQAYEISENNLPKINLAETESLNLKDYKDQINNLKEGQFLTIGREGDIKTANNSFISRQHIVIYRSNGKLKIKDISSNGSRIEENGFLNNINNKIKNILNNFNNKISGDIQFTPKEINLLKAFRDNPTIKAALADPKTAKKLVQNIDKILSDKNITPPEIKESLETGYATFRNRIKCDPDENILNDIVKLANGEDYIKHFNPQASLEEVYSQTPVGEVANWGGQLYVNNGRGMKRINLSEKTFRKLFPPVKRFSTHQGRVGTCYLVSSLERLYASPQGRAEIYNLIGEDSNGIYTQTYNGKGQKTYFKRFDSQYKHIQEESGLAIIEQGFCKNSQKGAMHFNASETVIMQLNNGGWATEAIYGLIGKNPSITTDKNTMKNYIMQYANDENIILNFGTVSKAGLTDADALSTEFDLFAGHEYSIKGYDQTTDCVIISNPWHSDITIKVPMYIFLQHAEEVSILGL